MARRWYGRPMRVTMDGAGRVVIPKAVREELALDAGVALELTVEDGRLVLEQELADISHEALDGRPVLVSDRPMPPLTAEDVRAVVERLRR